MVAERLDKISFLRNLWTHFKAQEIDANPNVALVFYWNALNRSVRIEGKAERIPASESEDYFR